MDEGSKTVIDKIIKYRTFLEKCSNREDAKESDVSVNLNFPVGQ